MSFREKDITGRSFCVAFVAGAGLVQTLPALPGASILLLAVAATAAACAVCMRARHPGLRILAALALGFSAGLLNAAVQAQLRMDDALADMHQDEVSRLVVRVVALPEGDAQRQRFLASISFAPIDALGLSRKCCPRNARDAFLIRFFTRSGALVAD